MVTDDTFFMNSVHISLIIIYEHLSEVYFSNTKKKGKCIYEELTLKNLTIILNLSSRISSQTLSPNRLKLWVV